MKIQKLNESFSMLVSESEYDKKTLSQIYEFLKAEKADAKHNFKIQKGWESPFHYFCKTAKDTKGNTALKIFNGHFELIRNFVPNLFIENKQEFSDEYIKSEIEEIKKLMPFTPYDFQEKCAFDSIKYMKQMSLACTGSGKSAIIFIIMNFFYRNNKKGYLIVPNINLLTQLYDDFGGYFKDPILANSFLNEIDTQGGGKSSNFESFLTISTWQSLLNRRDVLDRADFILCDELHRYKSEETSKIVEESLNATYKLGLTGTLPELDIDKLTLIGLFGVPRRYIRTSELIERGLGTPININSIILKYSDDDKKIFDTLKGQFTKQLKFIEEHKARNNFIVNLTCKVKENNNTLVLFQHTNHGKQLFIDTMKKLYPEVIVENKHITGKKSFEFQEKYGIYFLNGEDDPITRELTRKILEEHDNAILIANYALLSTGVNIKKLFNMILASPLRSYTTIAQSIGRGIRLHPLKKIFNVYDIIDYFGIFISQYNHRKKESYNSEGLPITERNLNLF